MIIFCVALLVFCGFGRGSGDFSTKTVNVGEEVKLKCSRQLPDKREGTLFWVKLAVGNLPEVLGATYTFDNGNVNKTPRITTRQEPGTFVLQIDNTEPSDAAFYYCEIQSELRRTIINITLLRVRGPETVSSVVVQHLSSDAVHSGDPTTLQCSFLFDSNRACSAEPSVYWFRAGSDASHPVLIYTTENSDGECERSPETLSSQKCIYNFTRNAVSASDTGTYVCAVASCGHILFGNGTNLDLNGVNVWFFLLIAALTLSLLVITMLIYIIKTNKCDQINGSANPQTNAAVCDQQSQNVDENSLVYTLPSFGKRKTAKKVKRVENTAEDASIYADVSVLGYE